MLTPPFLRKLEDSQSILIAGAGGGFDVFCGLPLFFALRKGKAKVHLANLSFSFRHGEITGEHLSQDLVKVTAGSMGNDYYFPEKFLCQWMARKNMDHPIYCLRPGGIPDVLESYKRLQERLQFDAVILVDGGVDSILRGDENRIGTPLEDMSSLAALMQIDVPCKQLLCLGYGAETDVCHASALETIAQLTRNKAFLGGLVLSSDMEEVKMFVEACEFVFFEMRGYESVICSSIISALEGKYGDHHRTRRTVGSKLWINPLMTIYWAFDVLRVTQSIAYFHELSETKTVLEISRIIRSFREQNEKRPIPGFISGE